MNLPARQLMCDRLTGGNDSVCPAHHHGILTAALFEDPAMAMNNDLRVCTGTNQAANRPCSPMLMDESEFLRSELPPETPCTQRISNPILPIDGTCSGAGKAELVDERPSGFEEPRMQLVLWSQTPRQFGHDLRDPASFGLSRAKKVKNIDWFIHARSITFRKRPATASGYQA